MSDFWSISPAAGALRLRTLGFSPHAAELLVALKLRYEREHIRELPDEQQRSRFARWLYVRGRLSDELPVTNSGDSQRRPFEQAFRER